MNNERVNVKRYGAVWIKLLNMEYKGGGAPAFQVRAVLSGQEENVWLIYARCRYYKIKSVTKLLSCCS